MSEIRPLQKPPFWERDTKKAGEWETQPLGAMRGDTDERHRQEWLQQKDIERGEKQSGLWCGGENQSGGKNKTWVQQEKDAFISSESQICVCNCKWKRTMKCETGSVWGSGANWMQTLWCLHWDVICYDDKESQGLVVGESGREGEMGDRERDGHEEKGGHGCPL